MHQSDSVSVFDI